jgi:hypothetical protein
MAEELSEFKSKSDLYERELAAAKKELEAWHTAAERVVKRYLGGKTTSASASEEGGVFNLFWSNCNILKAALFAKQPRADVSRRHKDFMDDVARVAGNIIERILNFDMDSRASDFDQALRNVIEDRLIPGMGQMWLRYEPTFVKRQVEPVVDPMTGQTMVEGGEFEVIGDEHVAADYVYWKDFLYSPARTWKEVRWVARGVWMTRDQLREKFGHNADEVPLISARGAKSSSMPENDPWQKAQVWEIWNKETRYVCWKVLGFDKVLGEQSDPLGLTDFFPCPKPLMANFTTTAFKPKADYQMLRDQYVELDVVTARIALLEDAIRVAGVYDKGSPMVAQLVNNRIQNVMIPADNWAMFAEKGGIKGAVDWFPLDIVIVALEKLRDVKRSLMQDLYELTGLSDIMRGATVASETATAQQLKAQYGSVRMQFMQGELAEFVQSALGIKAEIMAAHFQPETLKRRSLIDKTPDAQLADSAVQLLRDKRMAIYSLAVDPDTMAMVDYAAEQQARVECITAISMFIQSAWPLAQAKPESVPFLLQVLQWLLAGFKGGKQIESVLDQAITLMQNAPPGPQQPSPAQMEVEANIKAKQLETQADIKAKQIKTQSDIQLDWQKHAADAKQKQMKTVADAALRGLAPGGAPGVPSGGPVAPPGSIPPGGIA